MTMRIAIVVPAHNEEKWISRCLLSLGSAIAHATCYGHSSRVYVVCDACDDQTEQLVIAAGYSPLITSAKNVGVGRALGAQHALNDGAEWLSFTDADTEVAKTWLTSQVSLRADAVCGTVQVDDWGTYGDAMRQHFAATYFDIEGHRHIHGANLGVSASAYRRVGGFAALKNSEDVGIVKALEKLGAAIAWSNLPRVVTSARRDFRATAGFGATLAIVAKHELRVP